MSPKYKKFFSCTSESLNLYFDKHYRYIFSEDKYNKTPSQLTDKTSNTIKNHVHFKLILNTLSKKLIIMKLIHLIMFVVQNQNLSNV